MNNHFNNIGGTPSSTKDDKFYDEVAREIHERKLVAGIWTKAYAEMGGDEAKARAQYIKYRVEQLRKEESYHDEKLKSDAKRNLREERLAAEAAKPPLKWYDKLANFLLGCLCGCVSLLFLCLVIAYLSEGDRAKSGMSIVETVVMLIFIVGIALGFGFITYKCFRSAFR